jgi:MoxR-like ATPase
MSVVAAIKANLSQVIRGKDQLLDLILVALCSNGHVLLEDVPGVGKTTLAKALARSVRGDFRRIQFTPDLLPTDIAGGMIYCAQTGDFSFRPGPIFSHVLLADEINRASPRTQSALLEAMSERQVTVEGKSYPLAAPFMVLATQNPIEYHGTYPLPEAQLDRFAMRLEIGYPDESEELEIVLGQRHEHPLEQLSPVTDIEEILKLQQQVRDVQVEESVTRYLAALVRETRQEPRLRLGASPRATLTYYRTCQALAFVEGRDYVIPDDVQRLAVPVLAHRLMLDTKAKYSGLKAAQVLAEIISRLKVPV